MIRKIFYRSRKREQCDNEYYSSSANTEDENRKTKKVRRVFIK